MFCPRTQQARLQACSPHYPYCAKSQAGKLCIPLFKVFWFDSTWEMKPRSTDCEADAPTITPSRQFVKTQLVLIQLKRNYYRFCNFAIVAYMKAPAIVIKMSTSLILFIEVIFLRIRSVGYFYRGKVKMDFA